MLRIGALVAIVGLALVAASAFPWGSRAGAVADPAYGQQLFAAKGCVQCHHHAAFAGSGTFGGMYSAPDLTNRPGDPAYQRAWLRDPRAVDPNADMPNLGLNDAEIDALVAFLQSGAASSR